MATPAQPTILAGQPGFGSTFTKVMDEDFEGSGTWTDSANFAIEDMTGSNASEHRTGNFGQDRDGNPGSGAVEGARWAMWYDNHYNQTMVKTPRGLRMKGYASGEANPTRTDYTDTDGVTPILASQDKLYCGFLRSYARRYDNALGHQILDPSQPNKIHGPGHFYEISLDLSEQLPDGFRFSWWLMPATDIDGDVDKYDPTWDNGDGTFGAWRRAYNAYDGNAAGGAEIDVLEIEHAPFPNQNQYLMKVISSGDSSGNTPNGTIDLTSRNLRAGVHKFGFLHLSTGLYWFVDGDLVQQDEVRVPLVPMGQVISREGNTGIGSGSNPPAIDPKRPEDTGLFGNNIYKYKDNFVNDAVYVGYNSVWAVSESIPIAGKIRRSPVGTIKQRLFFSWEADDENFDYDAHNYLWVNIDIPVSAGPVLKNANTREMILEFTGTIPSDIVAHIDCQVTVK